MTTSTTSDVATLPLPETQPSAPHAQMLDLAFCCDCTGSMGAYIASAQENIRAISSEIHRRLGTSTSVRFALVKYRDHPPQERTFVTEAFPFTDNLELMKRHVDTMTASGGGDGPEAVAAGLKELLELQWRSNATKVAVLIADAPPHGLGESGDGFPNGCPLGNDPVKICKALAAVGVTIYAVGVEPILSTEYKYARDFMMMVASITDGKFLPLGKAAILTDVVVNGAIEGANLKAVWDKLENETKAEAALSGEVLTAEGLIAKCESKLEAQKDLLTVAQVDVVAPYSEETYDRHNAQVLERASSLSDARRRLSPSRNAQVPQAVAAFGWAAQPAVCAPMVVQPAQVSRAAAHAKKAHGLFY